MARRPEAAPSVATRLAAARARAFVGREGPLDLFRAALEAEEEPAFSVLFLHGPGGVGKTTLLRRLLAEAEARDVPIATADGHAIPATEAALLAALGAESLEALTRRLAVRARAVVAIDTYELLAPLDDWIRESLAPSLPAGALLVLTGREPPRTEWRRDPGWAALLRSVALRNLSPDESARLLEVRGVPRADHAAIHALTYGHPLALALVADLRREGSRDLPALTPDVIGPLLGSLLRTLPSDRHREALEVAALARVVDRSLLAEVLGDESGALHAWLCTLSFVDAMPEGLFVHDVVRDALFADARFRDPEALSARRARLRARAVRRLATDESPARERAALDLLHNYRADPAMRPYFGWREQLGGRTRPMRPDELDALEALAAVHEGKEAREVAHALHATRPDAFVTLESASGEVLGFLVYLTLDASQLESLGALVETDAVAAAAARALAALGALRPGEQAAFLRFWLWKDGYQELGSAAHAPHSMHLILHWTSTPALGPVVVAVQRADVWAPFLAGIGFRPLAGHDGDVVLGDHAFRLFTHDFRREPVTRWSASAQAPAGAAKMRMARVVLSHEDFAAAVREALRSAARPTELGASPLLGSRLLVEWAEDEEPTASMIVELLAVATSSLDDARDDRPRRAVELTYLRPAPTQELAAERLGLSFSTYRRQLARGVDAVIAYLWDREVRGAPADPEGRGRPS